MTTHVTFNLGEKPEAHLVSGDGHEDFVSVYLTPEVHAFAHTRAECDAAIKAILLARDLLPPDIDTMITALDAQPDLSDGIDPRTWREMYDAGLVSEADVIRAYRLVVPANRAGNPVPPADRCDVDWGSGTGSQRCTLDAGHDGNHIDGIGHAWAVPPVTVTA